MSCALTFKLISIGLPSPAALSDTHRQMVWNATKPSQDSPPISPLVNGFPAPSMGHGVYSFPHMASSQDGTMKSPLLPGVSLPGVSARHHFIPSSTVGYGPPSYSSTSIIQAPNGNYKVPITPSEQGSAFMVPKLEPNRSPTNSPHM